MWCIYSPFGSYGPKDIAKFNKKVFWDTLIDNLKIWMCIVLRGHILPILQECPSSKIEDILTVPSADLDQHMRRAHSAMYIPRDRTCNICGEKFTKFANLRRHHQRVHEGVKVTCEICQKRVSNIDKHRKVHKAREQPNNPNFQEDVVKEL